MRGLKNTTAFVSVIILTLFCVNNVSADNEYMVEKGDSLSKIGALLGVPWEEIMKANNLKNTVIHPKQILIIPSAGKAYNSETPTKPESFVKIPPPSFLESQVVQAPSPVPVDVNQQVAPTAERNPVPHADLAGRSYSDGLYIPPIQGNTLSRTNDIPKPEEPVTYMVRNGDTVWSISRNFGLTLRELQKANDMATSKIYPGQVLAIPKKVVVAAN